MRPVREPGGKIKRRLCKTAQCMKQAIAEKLNLP